MVFLLKTFFLTVMLAPTGWASIIDQQMIDRATFVGINDHQRLEFLYLQAFTAELLESSYQYAALSGKPISYELDNVRKLQKCQEFMPELAGQQQRISSAQSSDHDQYFLHLTTLSLLLVQMNLKMHRLGVELKELNSDVLVTVMNDPTTAKQNSDSEQRKKDLEAKIKVLSDNIDSIFTNDSSNFLLTMEVQNDKGEKLPFFHKLASDYYNMASEGIVGKQMIIEIQRHNSKLLLELLTTIGEQTKNYLQTAWDHSCRKRKIIKRNSLKRVGFYLKHQALMDKVEASLANNSGLLTLHQQLREKYSEKFKPSNYQTSAQSFLSLLGVLTAPTLFVGKSNPRKLVALPIIAATGVAFTYRQVKTLMDLREQLEIGAFTSLNSYQQYRYFKDNTSVSKYTASHLTAVALALIFVGSRGGRRPPKDTDKIFTKGAVNIVGSLSTLFYIEGKARGTYDMFKDENFSFNMLLTLGLDFAVGVISAYTTMSYGSMVAMTALATGGLSILTHVIMGRPMDWDRIVFDIAFISLFSLFKGNLFLAKIPNAIQNSRFRLPNKGLEFASWIVLSLTSNILGNAPYTHATRLWMEEPTEYGRLPINDGTTQYNVQPDDLSKDVEKLIKENNFTSESLRKLIAEHLRNNQVVTGES